MAMTQEELEPILETVFIKAQRDLSGYSTDFLHSIIRQRLDHTRCTDILSYTGMLNRDQREIQCFVAALNISFSQFFRDPLDFLILGRYLVPEISRGKHRHDPFLRIWSAACAEGQEPYSLAIMMEDQNKVYGRNCPYSILATDIADEALEKARRGMYDQSLLSRLSHKTLSEYFVADGSMWKVCDPIRKKIEFVHYDILDEFTTAPPSSVFTGYDIIYCSNLLIYYKERIRIRILRKLYYSLNPGGCLVVDESEKEMVKTFPGFHPYSNIGNIFVKLNF